MRLLFEIFRLLSQPQDEFLQWREPIAQHGLYGNPDAFHHFFSLCH